jgi:hypothetical protein
MREVVWVVTYSWAFEQARELGCVIVKLTCDRARPDAHRFSESLGFVPSHIRIQNEILNEGSAIARKAALISGPADPGVEAPGGRR